MRHSRQLNICGKSRNRSGGANVAEFRKNASETLKFLRDLQNDIKFRPFADHGLELNAAVRSLDEALDD